MTGQHLTRLLLLLYPPSLRRDHGTEISQAVSDGWRERRGLMARVRFIVDLLKDFLTTWPRAWRSSLGPTPTSSRPPIRRRGRTAGLWTDLRQALRLFRQAPLFALSAVVTLSLGIGATTALYSLADATLLRPFPFPEAHQLVRARWSWSQPDFRDLHAQQRTFSSVGAWALQDFALDSGAAAITVKGAAVSGGFFNMTGIEPLRGRLIGNGDDQPNAAFVAVMSERLWRRRLNASPAAVGSTIQVNGQAITIIGISPARFRGMSLTEAPELFVPLGSMPSLRTGFIARQYANRNAVWLNLGGRLRPDVTVPEAEAEIEAIYRQNRPPRDRATGAEPQRVDKVATRTFGVTVSSELGRFVLLLAGATIVSLLLSCATVANLLLMRAEHRQRELAVRAALGAGRWPMVRLLLIESLTIGATASLAGLVVARTGLALLSAFSLPGGIPVSDLDLGLSPMALAVAVGLGLLTSVVFGLAPLWRVLGINLTSALRDGSRGSSPQPLRTALVASQVAVCVLLLGGSLAFGRAMRHALSQDFGFDTEHTLAVTVDPLLVRYDVKRLPDFQNRMLEALSARPWVEAAGWSAVLPMRGRMTFGAAVRGYQPRPDEEMGLNTNVVSRGYFEATGIRLRAGRFFTIEDTTNTTPVAIASEALARVYWPEGRALGGQLTMDPEARSPVWLTVVGIVGDLRRGVDEKPDPMLYVAGDQHPELLGFIRQHLMIRSTLTPEAAGREAAAVVREVDRAVPISSTETMQAHVGQVLMAQRMGLTLFALFAALAVALTTFGLYAVAAYAVARRTREIGIRMALGAPDARVLRLVARQGAVPVAAGLIVGAIACTWAGRAMQQFLFAQPAFGGWAFAGLTGAIAIIAGVSMIVPARRALTVDPAVTLRSE